MFIELVTLLTFLVIVAAVFVLRGMVLSWRGQLPGQLAAQAAGGPDAGVPVTVFGELTDTLAQQIPPLLVTSDNLQQDLRRAGYYKPSARNEFLAIRNVLAILVVIFTGVLAVMVGPERPELTAPVMIWGFAGAALVYVLPWLYLKFRVRHRLRLIGRALPDAFDMLSMCLSGGLSIHEALAHVSREIFFSHPDLAVELEIVRQHTEMSTLGDAFKHFARRIDVPEVVALMALVQQTERLGSDVVDAVRQYSDGIRLKQRQTADERASKAGIKLLFPLVLCLAPSALIILWGPAVLELRSFFASFGAE